MLRSKGPLLLACNHPNSFLDSIILDTLMKQPVWALARGDAFKNGFISRILASLKILPVYRTSEGVENLTENYRTFSDCVSIFRHNGVIQIFSEGKCTNEWHLRPLKKGTARLAIKTWEEGIDLQVLPVGINYSSFRYFGKNIFLNFGEPISRKDFNGNVKDGLRHQSFNNLLQQQLSRLVYEIPAGNIQVQQEQLTIKLSPLKKILLAMPAFLGWLIHVPLYFPIKLLARKYTIDNDHFDSVMTALLILIYPLYLLLILVLLLSFTNNWWWLSILLLVPFTAWSFVQLKKQV